MNKLPESSKPEKTTVVLSIVLSLLVIIFIAAVVIYSACAAKLSYKVYGGMTKELKDSNFFEDISSGRPVCFLGDSITAGTVTGGIGWYQPLLPYIRGDVSELSYPGWKVSDLTDHKEEIPEADIYIVAIGINDILFPEEERSSADAEEFIKRTEQLSDIIKEISPEAKIYFITPWTFLTAVDFYNSRGELFRTALKEWCSRTEYICIDPDPVIRSVLENEDYKKYMYNEFHPNAPEGVGLFSYAVLKADHDRSGSS